MSSQSIIIQITQTAIDAIVSGETEITPEKILNHIGQIYDENSNYIFEIKENITIPPGKTLKGFENIVVNPFRINNGGTIENCTITFNGIKDDYNAIPSIIINGYQYYDDINDKYINYEGNINDCNINLNINSFIYNGNSGVGNITGGNITLSGSSEIRNNNGSITGGNITLSGSSEIKNYYNGSITGISIALSGSSEINNFYDGSITGGNITLSDVSKFYNYTNGSITGISIALSGSSIFYNSSGNITGSNITLSGISEFYNINLISNSYIFLHDEAILQNFYVYNYDEVYYGILTDNYIIAFDTCQILISYNGKSGTFDSIILKFSDNCTIDSEIEIDKIIIGSDVFILSKLISLYVDKIVNKLFSQIGLSKNADELVKRIKLLLSNLPNDMSEQLVNKSSDSIQKLLLLLLLNKSDNDLTGNINRLLK